jgi:lipopolysaccharide cholinephosphotransferase
MTQPLYRLSEQDHDALKAALLDLLLEFDRVCRQHRIAYQLAAGTLLGAVRHQGFIPWDDDVDVCMLRSDYERFLTLAPASLGERVFLQNRRSDPAYPHLFSKLRLNDSLFREAWVGGRDMHHGIYIDIFPFDNVKPETIIGRLHIELSRLALDLRGRAIDRLGEMPARKPASLGISARRLCMSLIMLPLRLLGERRMDALADRLLQHYAHEETSHVTCLASMPSERRKVYARLRNRAAFFRTVSVSFERHSFPAPANHDQVLTNLYGDYRRLPPSDQRQPKHVVTGFSLARVGRG